MIPSGLWRECGAEVSDRVAVHLAECVGGVSHGDLGTPGGDQAIGPCAKHSLLDVESPAAAGLPLYCDAAPRAATRCATATGPGEPLVLQLRFSIWPGQ